MSHRRLSDSEILSQGKELAQRGREATLHVLLCLNEIERRGLYRELGFKSLYEYCTSKLGYGTDEARDRIRAARCVVRFPHVSELLLKGDLDVETISLVSHVLNDSNQEEIFSRIRGKSEDEVEAIVMEYEG